MSPAEVLVLGPVGLLGEAGPIPLPAKLQRLLAAFVVAHGRGCQVDELVEALWCDAPPASARNLLRIYVSQLRKVLPSEIAVATTAGSYRLTLPPDALDAARFERLLGEAVTAGRSGNAALAASLAAQALALWRGRAYGDLAYEEVAASEADRLEELRLAALEERIDAQLALGHSEVVAEAVALAAEHPLRERLQGQAMLALYRSERQAEALDVYALFRRRLDEELGLEPSTHLRDLQRRVLNHDPSLLVRQSDERFGDLPAPPNEFVGRDRELHDLAEILARRDARLLVLTGAGGSGKTRLALEAARRAAESFANGVLFVDLAPLRDPALVADSIARALGLADTQGAPTVDTVASALRTQELLLVLDNVEHLRDAAPLFVELVANARRLTLIVTSRAVLHVSGEHVFPVNPLAEDDALQLFVERAQVLEPEFALTPDTETDIREICRRVDCLPLAIELAAARIRTLTPRALRERLDTRLGLLTNGPRDLPARQQSVRETIVWSVDLLGERERGVFSRMSVFAGGATLEAAESVCGADLDALASLVDDHLVRRDNNGWEARFGMLETVREHALELLGEQRIDAELALAAYLADLVDALRLSEGTKPEWRRAVERLEPEVENARVGLTAAAASADTELLLRLAGGLWRYWWVRGSADEGLAWIDRALAGANGMTSTAHARALYGGAALSWSRGDVVRAKHLAQMAISVAVDAGSEWYELAAHTVLGNVAQKEGDLGTARHHHLRSLELKERLGLQPLVEKLNLGAVALDAEDYEEAMTHFDDVLDSYRRDGDPVGTGMVLLNIGRVHHERGDHRSSRRSFEDARAGFEQVGFRSHVAYALQGLAAAEASEGRFEQAALLLGQARRELDDTGSSEDGSAPAMVAWTKRRARSALGDEAFETAYSKGRESDAVVTHL